MSGSINEYEAYKLYKKYKNKYKMLVAGANNTALQTALSEDAEQVRLQGETQTLIKPPLKSLTQVCNQPGLDKCKEANILTHCTETSNPEACRQMYRHINDTRTVNGNPRYSHRINNELTKDCSYPSKKYGMGNAPRVAGETTCRRVVKEGGAVALAEAANKYELQYQQQQQALAQQQQQEAAQLANQQQQQAVQLQQTVGVNQENCKENPLSCMTQEQRAAYRKQQQDQLAKKQLAQQQLLEQEQEKQRLLLEKQQTQATESVSDSTENCDIDVCSTVKQNQQDISRLQVLSAEFKSVPEIQKYMLEQADPRVMSAAAGGGRY